MKRKEKRNTEKGLIIKRVLQSISSRTGFLSLGFFIAIGTTVTFSAWSPASKSPLDPLYSADWNNATHHASSWERSGNTSAPGTEVFLNTSGGVGIGNASVSAGLKLDVDGNVGATEYCDSDGENCITTADIIDGELAGMRGVTLDGGLEITNSTVGILTSGCTPGNIMVYRNGIWNCENGPNSLATSTLNCNNEEIAKYNGTDWVCASGSGDLSTYTCDSDEILRYVGGNWQCDADVLKGCVSGEIPKFNGTNWVCGTDNAGGGGGGGGDLDSYTCSAGQVVKYISGSWQCAFDDDTGVAGYNCNEGEIIKFISGSWQCAIDSGSGGGSDADWTISGDDISSEVSGNVGIGTTSPSTKFEVQGGSIKATDGLIIEVRTTDPSGAELIDGRMWLRSDIL